MYTDRGDDIHLELFNFKVMHGHSGIHYLFNKKYEAIPNVSKDIKVVSITNMPYQNYLNKIYIDNPDKIDYECIILNTKKFRCGIDLIIPLYEYIKTIDNPYVLYMDASDCAILSEIENPKEILDFYNCKILFNAEDSYSFPDHGCVDKSYLKKYAEANQCDENLYYGKIKQLTQEKNCQSLREKMKNITPYVKSLNSGLFLGEREYMIQILSDMIDLMNEDPSKGYPYGELENQKLWQYLQSECKNNEIEIDYLNKYFLWTHDRKFNFPSDHWEHFNYFNKLIKI
jgi:hypothetical protein